VKSHIAGLTKRFGYFGAPKYLAPAAMSGKKQYLCVNISFSELGSFNSRKDAEINPIAIGSA
jgi:hypothetical protein